MELCFLLLARELVDICLVIEHIKAAQKGYSFTDNIFTYIFCKEFCICLDSRFTEVWSQQ